MCDVWICQLGLWAAGGRIYLNTLWFCVWCQKLQVYINLCHSWEGLDHPKHSRRVSSFCCCTSHGLCVCPKQLGIETDIWSSEIFVETLLLQYIINEYLLVCPAEKFLALLPLRKGQRLKSAKMWLVWHWLTLADLACTVGGRLPFCRCWTT